MTRELYARAPFYDAIAGRLWREPCPYGLIIEPYELLSPVVSAELGAHLYHTVPTKRFLAQYESATIRLTGGFDE